MKPQNESNPFIHSATRTLDQDIAHLVRQYQGDYGFEDQLFVPSEDNVARVRRELEDLSQQIETSSLRPFWHHHFESLLTSFSFNLSEHQHMPHHYLSGLAGGLKKIDDLEGDECLKHCRHQSERFEQIQAVVDVLSGRLPDLSPTARQELINTSETALKAITERQASPSRVESFLGNDESRRLWARLERAQSALKGLIRQSKTQGAEAGEEVSAAPFARVVGESLALDLDYILSWYQEDFDRRWQEYVDGAQTLGGGKDHPSTVLEKLSPPYTSAQTMLEEGRVVLDRVREAARKYIRLPAGEACQVVATPDYLEFCPTAVYMGGNVHEAGLEGRIGLNAENYSAFSRAILWGTMAHEGYPGHHAHFVLSGQQRLPETFLLYLPLSRPLVEGVAHRTEMLMAPSHEDDVARLATARRVLFCAARVRAVMELGYHNRPADDIFDMYHHQLKVNEFTARSQVRAHLRMPGDALSFYTGARMLRSWEEDLAMDPATFTQIICSFGFVGINTMGAILRLNDEEREALANFRS